EANPLYQGKSALDFIQTIFPVTYLFLDQDKAELGEYLRGMSEGILSDTLKKRLLAKSKKRLTVSDFLEVNELLLGQIGGHFSIRERKAHSFSFIFLDQAYELIKYRMPASFFEMSLFEWVKTVFLPEFQIKRRILETFSDLIKSQGFSAFEKSLENRDSKALSPEICDHLERVDPIPKETTHGKLALSLSRFISEETFLSSFIFNCETEKIVREKQVQVDRLIEDAETFLKTGVFPVPNLPALLTHQITPTTPHLACHAGLFILPAWFHLENERILLSGAAISPDINSAERVVVERSLKKLAEKSETLRLSPHVFHAAICQSKEAWMALLRLPYLEGLSE
ncbi:MAG: hypothetical protein ACI9BD_000881, partial [Candidatus Marinamargulisbacteria bacterium]